MLAFAPVRTYLVLQLPLQLRHQRAAVSLVDDPTAALAFAVRRRRVTPQHAALPKDTRVDGIRKRKVCDAQPVLKQTSTN